MVSSRIAKNKQNKNKTNKQTKTFFYYSFPVISLISRLIKILIQLHYTLELTTLFRLGLGSTVYTIKIE